LTNGTLQGCHIHAEKYDRALNNIHKMVFDIEEAEDPPKLKLSATNVELGTVKFVEYPVYQLVAEAA
jgi:hypothetical protein